MFYPDKYFEAEAELGAKGFRIFPIAGGTGRFMDSNWIMDGKLYIDSNHSAYLDYTKELDGKGYSGDMADWATFGFLGPDYVISYVMDCVSGGGGGYNIDGTRGDWAICEPPLGLFGTGSWVFANKKLESDLGKKAAVAELIEWMTLDCTEDGLQYTLANGLLEYGDGSGSVKTAAASRTVMETSDGMEGFLGGQDVFDVFIPAGRSLNGGSITEYDAAVGEIWSKYVNKYSQGECTRAEAIAAFKREVKEQLGIDAW